MACGAAFVWLESISKRRPKALYRALFYLVLAPAGVPDISPDQL